MTETDLKNLIRVELSKLGCKVFNQPTGMFFRKASSGEYIPVKTGERGHSDLRGHRPDGKAFYIEVKRPDGKGRTSKEQEQFIKAMKESGAIAGVVNSVEKAVSLVFNDIGC